VVQARPEDLPTVVALFEEAGRWLESRGINQWSATVSERLRAHVAASIAAGETYLALLDGETVGMLRLQWADPEVWGERPPDAGYVHALAVRRADARRGIGAALLGWAAREIAAAGRQYLRLDSMASNAALAAYYRSAGFQDRGQLHAAGWSAQLWERPVTEDM
jgi:protein-tyrosine phosphatase